MLAAARPLAIAAVALGLALLTGCLDYDETLTLNADGSGSMALDETIDLSFEDEIKKVRPPEEGEDSTVQLPKKEEIEKSLQVEGITIKEVFTETKGKRARLKIAFEFKDLAALRSIQGFADRRLELEDKGDKIAVRYIIDGKKMFGLPTESKETPPPAKDADETEKKIDAILRKTRDSAKLKLTLKLPAKIVETTGKLVEGDERAASVAADGKPGSKPRLGSGDDIAITAVVPRAALEKALAKEKAAPAAEKSAPKKKP
jgi:hypothetical protein